jgi:hypothetical protein
VDNIKMDLREMEWDDMDWIDMAQNRPVEGFCEHGNKLSGVAAQLAASQELLSSMELVPTPSSEPFRI